MSSKAYCPSCRDLVGYITKEIEVVTEVDGEQYVYRVPQAYCESCGDEALLTEYQDLAQQAFNDAVREKQNIVTLAEIRDLPKKYNIGKRPLSRLLGWGEHTYSRFVDGAIPSDSYSLEIRDLYNNPQTYRTLLMSHRNRITPVAYQKSLQAVDSILNSEFPDNARLFELADRMIVYSGKDITSMALQKLIYYAQGFSMVLLPSPLISVRPKAWAAGPVYGALWHELKNHKHDYMDSVEDDSPFSAEEEEFIKEAGENDNLADVLKSKLEKHKSIAIIAAAAVVLCIIVGCAGSGTSEPKQEYNQQTSTAQESQAAKESSFSLSLLSSEWNNDVDGDITIKIEGETDDGKAVSKTIKTAPDKECNLNIPAGTYTICLLSGHPSKGDNIYKCEPYELRINGNDDKHVVLPIELDADQMAQAQKEAAEKKAAEQAAAEKAAQEQAAAEAARQEAQRKAQENATATSNAPQGATVYIAASGNGKKYRTNPNCSNMKGTISLSVSEAQARGYTACKKCY